METTKQCTQCGRVLPIGRFKKVRLSPDGYSKFCRDCSDQLRAEKRTRSFTAGGGVGGNPELAKFQPRELIEELRARGYQGELIVTKRIKL